MRDWNGGGSAVKCGGGPALMTDPGAGLAAIAAEMRRQHADARQSFQEAGGMADAAAAAIRARGRLALLGMGGSHAVNRVAEPLYRQAGVDATAHVISEILHAPLPPGPRAVMLTSQSGESGEVLRYLERDAGEEARFGLTLDAGSTLARRVPCLVGAGGVEKAFAATRSLLVSLALHARILQALGLPQAEALAALEAGGRPEPDPPLKGFSGVGAVVFSGRGAMQGVAEAAALGLTELARIPGVALEGGQLRHGPLEALGPAVGVVFIRAASDDASSAADLARIATEAGSPTLVFDLSGADASGGARTVQLPPRTGMAAALTVLPPLQRFIIGFAAQRVAEPGVPLRSSKVTREA